MLNSGEEEAKLVARQRYLAAFACVHRSMKQTLCCRPRPCCCAQPIPQNLTRTALECADESYPPSAVKEQCLAFPTRHLHIPRDSLGNKHAHANPARPRRRKCDARSNRAFVRSKSTPISLQARGCFDDGYSVEAFRARSCEQSAHRPSKICQCIEERMEDIPFMPETH